MNISLLYTFLILITSLELLAQDFQTVLTFSDSKHHFDTIRIGYDANGQYTLDKRFMESDISHQPYGILDVRIVGDGFGTKSKIIPFREDDWISHLKFEVHAKHYPVKIKWKHAAFADSSRSFSTLHSDSFDLLLNTVDSVLITKEHPGLYPGISVGFKNYKRVNVPWEYDGFKADGWNLIFEDNFNDETLNHRKWNKSTPDNDGTINCLYMGASAADPNLVEVNSGTLKLPQTEDDYYLCNYSASEVKTFGWDLNDSLNVIYMPKPGYLEVKAKLPIAQGVGSAVWLWGPNCRYGYSEIDLWETRGINNVISMNYHWDLIKNCAAQNRESSGRDVELWTYAQVPFGTGYQYIPLDLTSRFVIYGLEWSDQEIIWYVNGIVVRRIDLVSDVQNYNGHFPSDAMWLRLSSSGDLSGHSPKPDDLPAVLEIDYVKVFIRDGYHVSTIRYPETVCYSSTDIFFSYNHFPDVIRHHEIDQFKWDAYWHWTPWSEDWQIRRWQGTQFPAGQYTPLSINLEFPSGYIDSQTVYIYAEGPPTPPVGNIGFSQWGSSQWYKAEVRKSMKNANHYFSIDNGQTWQSGGTATYGNYEYATFGPLDVNTTYTMRVKVTNICQNEPNTTYLQTVTTPSTSPCPNCPLKGFQRNLRSLKIDHYIVYDFLGHCIGKYNPDVDESTLKANLLSGIYVIQYIGTDGGIHQTKKLFIP